MFSKYINSIYTNKGADLNVFIYIYFLSAESLAREPGIPFQINLNDEHVLFIYIFTFLLCGITSMAI